MYKRMCIYIYMYVYVYIYIYICIIYASMYIYICTYGSRSIGRSGVRDHAAWSPKENGVLQHPDNASGLPNTPTVLGLGGKLQLYYQVLHPDPQGSQTFFGKAARYVYRGINTLQVSILF